MRVEHAIARHNRGEHGCRSAPTERPTTAGSAAPRDAARTQPAPHRDTGPSPATAAGTDQVSLAGQVIALAALKQNPDRYTSLFSRARHEVGHAVCLCRTDQVVRLVIRLRSGRFHLATWPAGGHQHALGCGWHRAPDSMSGRSAYVEAITTGPAGTSIRLSAPLTITGASAVTESFEPPRVAGDRGSTVRRAMGLLGLLHWLWESAELHVWRPRYRDRSWRTCCALLGEQARDCRVNQRALADTLWIVPAFARDRAAEINTAWEQYLESLTGTREIRRRGLVLGEIRAVKPTDYGSIQIRLAHQRAPLYATAQLMSSARRSYPAVFSEQAEQPGCRRIALCMVERSPRGYANVVHLAAMLTSSSYVPADSSYEIRMSDALAASGRTFVKPLHFDGGDVFPDFVLFDEDPQVYVEVWGVRGRESYEHRKYTKQATYQKVGRRLVEWDVRDQLLTMTGSAGLRGCTPDHLPALVQRLLAAAS